MSSSSSSNLDSDSHTSACISNQCIQLRCRLDTTYKEVKELDRQLGRRLEWSICPDNTPPPSSSSMPSGQPYFISKDEVFFVIKGRTRTLDISDSDCSTTASAHAQRHQQGVALGLVLAVPHRPTLPLAGGKITYLVYRSDTLYMYSIRVYLSITKVSYAVSKFNME